MDDSEQREPFAKEVLREMGEEAKQEVRFWRRALPWLVFIGATGGFLLGWKFGGLQFGLIFAAIGAVGLPLAFALLSWSVSIFDLF
ncbi:MAG: hypothetical protein DWQ01_05725 [Planctomycetota bacterium]|nr:MAG: hypothetical protein DWQ01_05725 [Planctomycetota bacterium]